MSETGRTDYDTQNSNFKLTEKKQTTTMVKSKELKRLRKAIDQAERLVPDPLPLLDLPTPDFTATFYNTPLPSPLLEACLALFQSNMASYHTKDADTYMDEKRSELTHRTARIIVIHHTRTPITTTTQNDRTDAAAVPTQPTLAAFLHYRFCLDDDDDPTAAVVYMYELQVALRRRGLGRALGRTTLRIARQAQLPRVLLTVHTTNTAARALYEQALQFSIDASSPSQHGDFSVDYEIMSFDCQQEPEDDQADGK